MGDALGDGERERREGIDVALVMADAREDRVPVCLEEGMQDWVREDQGTEGVVRGERAEKLQKELGGKEYGHRTTASHGAIEGRRSRLAEWCVGFWLFDY